MGLKTYRNKRNFTRTPEPEGRVHAGGKQRLYVIQKHAATRLHYDLRLEEGGVLKSWAVPKGPSLDPKERRLAVQVEDHPLEYGEFEGVIPKGEYGGGRVQLWDRGNWVPEGDAAAGLRKGKLKFHLEGEKLRGGWNLVRMHGQTDEKGKTNWLLIKEHDEAAQERRDIVQERPESILSGRRIEDMESTDESVWHSNRKNSSASPKKPSSTLSASVIPGARKSPLPGIMPFQLATLTDRSPDGEEWLHEIKLDGFRMQCRIEKGRGQLLTRTGQDWTHRFPGVAQAAAQLPVQAALLDGELVALQPDGRSSFQLLQRALSEGADATLVYYAFDLLYLDGYDISLAPLATRKDALKRVLEAIPQDGPVRYSDHVLGGGQAFYEAACRLGLEGMIAKRKAAPYRGGRGGDWLKVKCLQRQEFVIGGFTDPSGSRSGFGALLLGVYEGKRLHYAGRVGTGFNTGLLKTLAGRLQQLQQAQTPFHTRVPGPLRDVHWVRPELVAEIAFTEWTSDNVLRHPSFQGLREDKKATDVKREIPQPPPVPDKSIGATATPNRRSSRSKENEVDIAGIHLTHPTRVLYPQQGLTKRDLASYYESIADRILPHIVNRPVMLLRCPEGYEKECFHQKHTNRMVPEAVRSIEIKEETGKASPYLMVDDLPGLIALVQMGALELHVWGSHAGRLEYPDRMVVDLDPDESLPWSRVVEAAELVRDRLTEVGLQSWVKTTGGKGLHVVVPLTGKQTWDEVKGFSQALAERLVKENPDRYTSKMSKAGRTGKVFLDYLRNSRGATAVAAYSTRARAGATVSTPVAWDELPGLTPSQLTVKTVLSRLKTLKHDPWEEFWNARQSITQSARRAVGLK
jgi:bifunctional non-homologous end joining protein LigD